MNHVISLPTSFHIKNNFIITGLLLDRCTLLTPAGVSSRPARWEWNSSQPVWCFSHGVERALKGIHYTPHSLAEKAPVLFENRKRSTAKSKTKKKAFHWTCADGSHFDGPLPSTFPPVNSKVNFEFYSEGGSVLGPLPLASLVYCM